MFGLFKKKCPKCDSKKIKIMKPSLMKRISESMDWTTIYRGKTKNLNVCRDCGFSWEDR